MYTAPLVGPQFEMICHCPSAYNWWVWAQELAQSCNKFLHPITKAKQNKILRQNIFQLHELEQ